jgi:hypothetical protein
MAKKIGATNKRTTLPGAAKAAATKSAADKPTPSAKGPAAVASTLAAQRSTPSATPAARTVTAEQIARRAYEIYASGQGGTPEENWHQA